MFRLFTLRTNSCCCGISLRTGTITILILNLIAGILAILSHQEISRYGYDYWIGNLILIIIEIAALYGTFKEKPGFLIPHLVLHAISLIALLFFTIGLLLFLPFSSKAFNELTYVTSDGRTEHLDKSTKDLFYHIYVSVIVFLIIYEAIGFHFFKVVLSHYYELKAVLLNVNPPPVGFSA